MTETICLSEMGTEWPGTLYFSPYARLGVPMVEHHCRCCGALIYSRRQTTCGNCSNPLPDSALFTAEQRDAVSSVLAEERQRHREWLRRH